VFAFGGSVMWGMGAPDWGTLPAHLQATLSRELARPVCVVNFGERGHVSTQGVIQLIWQLQRGAIPDLVIFLDGVNDAVAGRIYRRAGLHMDTPQMAGRLEGTLGRRLLESSRLHALVRTVVAAPPSAQRRRRASQPAADDSLAREIVAVYLVNHRIVSALAERYGFRFEFFWQPHIRAGRKPLAPEERRIRTVDSARTRDSVLILTFRHAQRAAGAVEHLTFLGDVFDGERSLTYIDSHHITPDANRLVAERIMEVVRESRERQRVPTAQSAPAGS
jgi:lysophospholipase L1-like esterase